jgi:carboxymethylenebutenolidase
MGIPMDGVNAFIKAQADANPPVVTHIYDADHGFNCDARSQYDEDAATLAWDRTLSFLSTVSG